MATLDIEFLWPVAVAGYEIKEIDQGGLPGPYLVARGAEQRWQNPVAFHPALFRQFADLPLAPPDKAMAAFIDFASKFGLLLGPYSRMVAQNRGADRPPIYSIFGDEEPYHLDRVELWLTHVRRLRRLVSEWDRALRAGDDARPDYRDLLPRPTLFVDLVDRAGRPSLSFRPGSLLSAIDLQFYQAVTGTIELKACEHCGQWFERGLGTDRGRKARFCSDQCRFGFNNDKRARKGRTE